jgi:ubiquinone biosynthesis protein UbiJ
MNTTSPFSFLKSLSSRFQAPAWVVDEGQQKLVLLLNHVLMQEKEAQNRLLRHKGRVVHVGWGVFELDLVITPAGLLDRALPAAKPDLTLRVAAESPVTLVQSVLAGKAPQVTVEGDVQLAAELGWLADNLRWDVEEDLSRLIGDAAAHSVAKVARQMLAGLRQFVAQAPPPSAGVAGVASRPTATEPPKATS